MKMTMQFTGYCITIGGGTICVFVGCDIDVVCSIIVDDYCDVFIDSLLVFSPMVDCCIYYKSFLPIHLTPNKPKSPSKINLLDMKLI